METYHITEDEVYEFVSGAYNNFPVRESFKRNEHNKIMNFFQKNQSRISNN